MANEFPSSVPRQFDAAPAAMVLLARRKMVVRHPDELAPVLAGNPGLRTLLLEGAEQWHGDHLLPLVHCIGLRDLTLAGSTLLRDADLRVLSGLTGLRRLSLADCAGLSSAAMAYLAPLQGLQRIDLVGCSGLRDDALAILARLPKLTALDLRHCRGITARGLAHLSRLPNLQTLDLGDCPLIHDLAPLSAMAHLRSLRLSGNSGLQDQAFVKFANHPPPALRRLDLAGCHGLSDVAFAALPQLPQFETLSLAHCRIGTAGGSALRALPNLKELNVRACAGLAPDDRLAIRARPGLMRVELD